MGLERKKGAGEITGKIFEMGIRSGMGYAGLYGKRGIAEREVKR